MQETCNPATPETPESIRKIRSFFHGTAWHNSSLICVWGDSRCTFSLPIMIKQPTTDKIMLHYTFYSRSFGRFIKQISATLPTWQKEKARQKEINSVVLKELVSHTGAQNAHLRQELSPLGSAAALPSLFHH